MKIDALSFDPHALDLLDSYLSGLHQGSAPAKEVIIAEHPELANLLACVEDLELLAEPKADDTVTLVNFPTVKPAAGPSLMGDLGKYVLEEELGRGGMGVVYKARQKDLDRPVALKMILSGQLATPEQIGRFQDEARAVARLHHPNIVSIFEAGEILGQPFFAMQFVDGPSLAVKLAGGALASEAAARLVLGVARAVEHLHQNGIVHRDLKPSNILLDHEGVPYVTDFGLVKLVTGDSHRTHSGAILGTPSYMAPEQAAGKGATVGPLADVYSLGTILFEVLTGRPPFQEETPLDTLVQVLESEPPRPREVNPNVPKDLERICLRCLEKSPQDRYPSAAALALELERFLKGESVEALPGGLGTRLARWSRREPALVSRLIVLGICFVIAQISYYFHDVALLLHLKVQGILTTWALGSFLCQLLLGRERWAEPIRYLWAGLDVACFSAILYVDDALLSPIVVGYPVMVAAAGLWFRTRLVWFTTASALFSYAVLVAVEWRKPTPLLDPHKHLMFLVALGMLGFIVAYQVQRVRALSRFYERRPLP